MEDYNDYDHGMAILIEGVTKYFLLLDSRGGSPCPLWMSSVFLDRVNVNNDLRWLAHFLHDFGFLYWELRQSVRSNDSEQIDMIWRECVPFLHTKLAHKVHYAHMAVMRIYWAEAMNPTLARVYHQHRSISLLGLKGSNCGWDMPIEKLNLMLRNVQRPSKERYEKYVEELNFLGPVARGQERLLRENQNVKPGEMKSIQVDVQLVVDFLVEKLGGTWQEALVPREPIDSKLVNPPKSNRPWEEVEELIAHDGGRTFHDWVKGHLDSKVSWM